MKKSAKKSAQGVFGALLGDTKPPSKKNIYIVPAFFGDRFEGKREILAHLQLQVVLPRIRR
jgi:hypothetical protein